MRPFLLALACLALLAPPAASAGIVGGAETARTWPFMGYVESGRQEAELGDNQFCGASLIAPTWAITAAHCVTVDPLLDPVVTAVVFGRHAKSDTGAGERVQVVRAIQHESWDNPAQANDVMLLELERAPAAQPLKIAGAAEAALWRPGTPATILGWGNTTEGGAGSDVLREAQVPIVADADCGRAYPGQVDAATMVCAGFPDGGTDTCQGDSGGPLVVQAPDGTWRQAGVTSWGDGCARAEKFGIYSRIAGDKLRSWVAAIVPEAISTAPAPGPPPSPAPTPAPGQGGPTPPATQPAPSTSGSASRSASKRAAAAKRKRACVRKAKRIKSAKRRKRALRRCARIR